MKVAFFYDGGISSKLTRFFTGSQAYHVGFTDGNKLWDMNLLRRRRLWSEKAAGNHLLVECPVTVPAWFLENRLDTDASRYGVLDYLAFGLRRFIKRLRFNGKGVICSEMVLLDLKACGWTPPAWLPDVPSPADLELALLGRKNAIED
jgi:hypothetical protein